YDLTGTFALSLGSVQVSVGYDWEIPRGFRVFAELGFGFALGLSEEAFIPEDSRNLWQVNLGEVGYLEFPRFRLGIRIPLGKWESGEKKSAPEQYGKKVTPADEP
ncbi:MAG: hypothetical protein LBQ30_02580, partial [Treponema sp.]|nr:hypothetical protein [Treponema sp.]